MNNKMIKNLPELYKEIYADLKENEDQLLNRSITFSKKYRGDALNDVSVIIHEYEGTNEAMVRIFLKNKSGYINHTMSLQNKKLNEGDLIMKKYDEEE